MLTLDYDRNFLLQSPGSGFEIECKTAAKRHKKQLDQGY